MASCSTCKRNEKMRQEILGLIDYLAKATKAPGDYNLRSDDFIYGYKMGNHEATNEIVVRLQHLLKEESNA